MENDLTSSTRLVAPSAARLTSSLRDIGYSFSSAVADIVDNSITAGASRIDIVFEFNGENSRIFIADNGLGMGDSQIDEALRFGSRKKYTQGDLGRYGLGLKTASFSQCRRLNVVSLGYRCPAVVGRRMDLDFVESVDDWIVTEIGDEPIVDEAVALLTQGTGTVVIWEALDRVLPQKNPEGGWSKRRFNAYASKLSQHLSMVFHRFLDPQADQKDIAITINGQQVAPWDPFARREPETLELAADSFEVEHGNTTGTVRLRRFILPSRDAFSSPEAFERASGPDKWNRQQGLYIYRAGRLVQWGGWAGIRGIDEHTKLARAALDFDTDLDSTFNINVAKMRVTIPSQLRKMLKRPVNELCLDADEAYRRSNRRSNEGVASEQAPQAANNIAEVGLALRSAAARSGNYAAFRQISDLLSKDNPVLAKQLGF